MIKDYKAGPFDPMYVGDYCVVSIYGNQVEVIPVHVQYMHFYISQDHIKFGHKSKHHLNPDHIPDLHWLLASVNTKSVATSTLVQMCVYILSLQWIIYLLL